LIYHICTWHLQTGYSGVGQESVLSVLRNPTLELDKKDNCVGQILLAAVGIKNAALFSEAVEKIEEDVPPSIFFELGSTLDVSNTPIKYEE